MSLEFLLWLFLVFFIGCIIGCLLRWLFAPEPAAVATTPSVPPAQAAAATTSPTPASAEPEAKAKPASPIVPARAARPAPAKKRPSVTLTATAAPKPKPTPEGKAPEKSKIAPATGKPKRPRGLAQARGGNADNLQLISGVGPKLEKTLQSLGFFHFDQIAAWTSDEVMWVDDHLRFKGRIERDKWIPQAKQLASGNQTKAGSSAKRTGNKSGG